MRLNVVVVVTALFVPAVALTEDARKPIDPVALVGMWDVRETVTYSACSDVKAGDIKALQWNVSIAGGKLEATVLGTSSEKPPKLSSEILAADPGGVRFLQSPSDIAEMRLGVDGSLSGRRSHVSPAGRAVLLSSTQREAPSDGSRASAGWEACYDPRGDAPCLVLSDLQATRR